MKKIFAMMFFVMMVIPLSACGRIQIKESRLTDYISTESIPPTNEKEAVDSQSKKPDGNNIISNNAAGAKGRNLIVYFSRMGNTEYPEGIDASTSASIVTDRDTFGTTEYVARMIQENIGGDIHLIRTQKPYPADFNELRNVNHEEKNAGILPPLMESSLDLEKYDTVFIGYPVWATDVPQAVLSFLKEYDLTGKTVVPFCTHDGYGAGVSYNTIRQASHAGVSPDGLAIEAKEVPYAKSTVAEWLSAIGMTKREGMETNEKETAIIINIGDITYCEAHHNMAIFFAQTDNPTLSVDVIPIGRITSDLSVFDKLESREEITFSLAQQ